MATSPKDGDELSASHTESAPAPLSSALESKEFGQQVKSAIADREAGNASLDLSPLGTKEASE